METDTETIHDVTQEALAEYAPGLIVAHRKGENVLILRKGRYVERFDKKKGRYFLEYRWLSNPEYICCVQGNEINIWTDGEIAPVLEGLRGDKTLFDFFNLF